MRAIRPLHAGAINYNLVDARQQQANTLARLTMLLDKINAVDSIVASHHEEFHNQIENIQQCINNINKVLNITSTSISSQCTAPTVDAVTSEALSSLRQELLTLIQSSVPTFASSSSVATCSLDQPSPTSDTNEETVEDEPSDTFPTNDSYPYPTEDQQPSETPDKVESDAIEINGTYIYSTDKDKTKLGAISNTYGGLSIDKYDSIHRWVIERSSDHHLKFHINTENETPLSISRKGITTPRLQLNGCKVNNIATSVGPENINHNTIPTTKALFDFIHANMLSLKSSRSSRSHRHSSKSKSKTKDNVTPSSSLATPVTLAAFDGNDEESTAAFCDGGNECETEGVINCDVTAENINGKRTLVIKNESGSFTVKNNSDESYQFLTDCRFGLRINDQYRITDNEGYLCYIPYTQLPKTGDISDLDGLFVSFGTNFKKIPSNDKWDEIYVPEVYVTTDLTSSVVGVIKSKVVGKEYVHNGKIYDLTNFLDNPANTYITVITKGFVVVKTEETNVKRGSLLIPGTSNGYAVKVSGSESGVKAHEFCVCNELPRIKVIAVVEANKVLGVIL